MPQTVVSYKSLTLHHLGSPPLLPFHPLPFSMISRLFILSAIAFSAVSAQDNSDLIAKLLDAPTQVARINLLPDDAFKFDFVNTQSGKTVGSGGFSSSANLLTMPATIGNDVSMSTRNFCALVPFARLTFHSCRFHWTMRNEYPSHPSEVCRVQLCHQRLSHHWYDPGERCKIRLQRGLHKPGHSLPPECHPL